MINQSMVAMVMMKMIMMMVIRRMPTFHSLPDELKEVEVGAQEPGIRPEHVEAKSDVKLEVCHEEPS